MNDNGFLFNRTLVKKTRLKYLGITFVPLYLFAILVPVLLFLTVPNLENIVDNKHYIIVYESIRDLTNLGDIYARFIYGLGGGDPLSVVTFYIFSQFIEFELFILITNTILSVLIINLVVKTKRLSVSQRYVLGLIIIGGFYTQVLFLVAHRLKLAIIATLVAELSVSRRKQNFWLISAVLFHLQMIFYILTVVLRRLIIEKLPSQSKNSSILTIVILISIIVSLSIVTVVPIDYSVIEYWFSEKSRAVWSIDPKSVGLFFLIIFSFFLSIVDIKLITSSKKLMELLLIFLIGMFFVIFGVSRLNILMYYLFIVDFCLYNGFLFQKGLRVLGIGKLQVMFLLIFFGYFVIRGAVFLTKIYGENNALLSW